MLKVRLFGARLQTTAAILLVLVTTARFLPGAPFAKQIQFQQPGGPVITLWGQGDEFYAVFETLDGYSVVFDPKAMAYCYASLSGDGTELVSTGMKVGASRPETLGLTPHLRISQTAIAAQVAERWAKWDAATGLSARWAARKAFVREALSPAAASPRTAPNHTTTGVKVGLTLLIDFSDDVATVPQDAIVSFCNGDNYTDYGNNGSVKEFYAYNSNGQLTYTNVVTIYIRAPNTKSYYCDVTKDAGLQARMLITDALAEMEARSDYATAILPLFNAVTVDSRNQVVAFNVYYAGDNGGVWSMGLWPHSWSLATPVELSPGGKKVSNYQISNIGTQLEIGTFCHENGHMLCDYPDLYDYTGASEGVGDYCLMAGGSWGGDSKNPGDNPSQICAYLKRASGWATTTDLTYNSSLLATVSASTGTNFNHFYRFANPKAATEYYLAECRQNVNHDAALPGSGVLVWHIDELGDNSSVNLNPNSFHNNYEATVVQADGRWDLEKNRNSGDSNDLYRQGNPAAGYVNLLSDTTAPNAHWWAGGTSGMVLRRFSLAGASMNFIVGSNDLAAPYVQTQPFNLTVFWGATANFTVVASGTPMLSYQWSRNGAPLPGATDTSLTISNAQLADAAAYAVTITNDFGSTTSSNAYLTVATTVPLPLALNNSNLLWTTASNAPWYGQTNLSHDTIASGRSYFIGDAQETALTTTVNGPGTLAFWWKVSSQTNADLLSFASSGTDSESPDPISGQVDWTYKTCYLPAGVQTLRWAYTKDATGSSGLDAGFVDQVSFVAGSTLPRILMQPLSQSTFPAVPVTFQVSAEGTPRLDYQWLFKGAPIAGATSYTFTLPSPTIRDAGFYSVRVTNPYGSALSADAYLGVVSLAAAGDNGFGQVSVSLAATNVISVAAGAWHSLALRDDSSVLAWGEDYNGQTDVPAGLDNVASVAAGGYHNLALKLDGTIVAWGDNAYGQTNVPPGLSNIIAVAAGTWHSLALRANGTVVGWGDNDFGQTQVPAGLANVIAIAAGGNHSLALRADHTVLAWGENWDAEGNYSGQSVVPLGLNRVVAIAAGDYHSLAIKDDGTVVAWGDNSQGQCDPPPGLTNVIAVAGGGGHSVALKADTTAVAWGNDWHGQCVIAPSLTNIVGIAAGSAHTLLLQGDNYTPPRLLWPAHTGNQFKAVVLTFPGQGYALECQTDLAAPSWTALSTNAGNGSLQTLTDTNATGSLRWYRVRRW